MWVLVQRPRALNKEQRATGTERSQLRSLSWQLELLMGGGWGRAGRAAPFSPDLMESEWDIRLSDIPAPRPSFTTHLTSPSTRPWADPDCSSLPPLHSPHSTLSLILF